MKIVILVPDGAADYPAEDTGKTPLEIALTPNLDRLATEGRLGQTKNCPDDMEPGSDVANMSVLGYDPHDYYTGRGPLEALSMGVSLKPDDIAWRCNLVTISDGIMVDYSAGHITSSEGARIMESLDRELGDAALRFYPGVSYRHLLVVSDGDPILKCTPPHDIIGQSVEEFLPQGQRAPLLKTLMSEAARILADHPVNHDRIATGKAPATDIWPWGQGKTPSLPSISVRFGLRGAVISAVDLVKGLGVAAGLDVIEVAGATGYFDTDYTGKAEAALRALQDYDLVMVHVEAPDEAGHEGNAREKVAALERFDTAIVGTIVSEISEFGDYRLLVVPDHATPLKVRTHTKDPVPFVIKGNGIEPGLATAFSEAEAAKTGFVFGEGHRLMEYLIATDDPPSPRLR